MKKHLSLFLFIAFSFHAATAQPKKPVINHIALYVHNLQKSKNFYQQVIQLDTVPEPFHDGRHVWLSLGRNCTLHLISGAAAQTPKDQHVHFCLSVDSLDVFITRLSKTGIVYRDLNGNLNTITTRVDGVRQIYLQDPDGYWVEINNDAISK